VSTGGAPRNGTFRKFFFGEDLCPLSVALPPPLLVKTLSAFFFEVGLLQSTGKTQESQSIPDGTGATR